MMRNLMLVPTLDCPAACGYCFGPVEGGGPVMTGAVVDHVTDWLSSLEPEPVLAVTFHGGEPLAAGPGYFRTALAALTEKLPCRELRFAVQSNLWLLTDEMCAVFREYGVSLGTSLDGPESVNDSQRGEGYFLRTMRGIERARSHGLKVGCVCTFTSSSMRQAGEVYDFFEREGLDFTVHPALPGIGARGAGSLALSPQSYGELLVALLDRYLESPAGVRVGTLDSLCRSVSARRGGICVFGDCLGGYLAVGPGGDIFPCQRFVGMTAYGMGNVSGRPSLEDLRGTPAWRAFASRQERVRAECSGCPHLEHCLGGCPYNALAAGAGEGFSAGPRDPYCPSYRRIFDRICDLALAEVFSRENLDAVVAGDDPGAGLLRRGRLLELMRSGAR